MTDPQTPATEAGRRHLQTCPADWLAWETREVAAIEAEARASRDMDTAYEAGREDGRADALREAADAVRAYGDTLAYRADDPDPDDVIAAVLDIMEPEP